MTQDASPRVQSAVSAAFRAEWGRVLATLIAVTGDWDLAEECMQGRLHPRAVGLGAGRGARPARCLADDRRP